MLTMNIWIFTGCQLMCLEIKKWVNQLKPRNPQGNDFLMAKCICNNLEWWISVLVTPFFFTDCFAIISKDWGTRVIVPYIKRGDGTSSYHPNMSTKHYKQHLCQIFKYKNNGLAGSNVQRNRLMLAVIAVPLILPLFYNIWQKGVWLKQDLPIYCFGWF